MLESSGPEFTSMRHARLGVLGAGGELPSEWLPEEISLVEILQTEVTDEGPGIKLRLGFEAAENGHLSLTLGAFQAGRPGSVFILSTNFTIDEIDNIDAVFGIIREWEVNGPFIRQSTREILLSKVETRVIVAHESKDHTRALQPVFTIRRKSKGSGGCIVTFRRTMFANLYDFPNWVRA